MKQRIAVWALAICALFSLGLTSGFAQINTTPGSNQSYIGGIFYAPSYALWHNYIVTGNASTGSQTILLSSGSAILQDGREIIPFAVGVPLSIVDGNSETVTITAVQNCNKGPALDVTFATCQITASFSNLHGNGAKVISGDNGYQEAVNDAGNNGGGAVYWVNDTGPMTLSTGGTTTTSTQTNFFPVSSIVLGTIGRVTTAITGSCTGWEIGDGTTAARFTANNTTLTAGTTAVNSGAAWNTAIAAVATGVQIAANKAAVVTCAGGNPTAGAIKVRAFGWTPVVSNY
jgi:hypothetical protein